MKHGLGDHHHHRRMNFTHGAGSINDSGGAGNDGGSTLLGNMPGAGSDGGADEAENDRCGRQPSDEDETPEILDAEAKDVTIPLKGLHSR